MTMDQYWEMLARNKAVVDYQDNPEAFLKGKTNQYSETVDPEMREAYESERGLIMHELRRNGK